MINKISSILLSLIVLTVSFLGTFTTVFAATDVIIEGSHKIEGVQSGTRTFVLKSKSTNEIKTIDSPVNEKFSFSLSFDKNGTYEYSLYEELIEAEGLTQDTSVYDVIVVVTNNGHTIIIKDKYGNKPNKIEFIDTYKEPEKPVEPEPEPLVPSIKTSLADASGNKEIKTSNNTVLIDTVSYTNLETNVEYKISGVLMDKETSKPMMSNGKEIMGKTIFTPTEKDGIVKVEFVFDSSSMEGKELVAFETITKVSENKVIAEHKDINDKDQTIKFLKEEKKIIPRIIKTGDNAKLYLWVGISVVAAALASFIIARRKHNDAQNQSESDRENN